MVRGTPAIRELERAGVAFRVHQFEHAAAERGYGLAAADALGVEPARVFKTLLATTSTGATTTTVVGIVPVDGHLSLKALAAAVGAKRAEMAAPADAERITGYVVGGISPFGQKRRLPTVVDETCLRADTIFVSGGRRGLDLEVAPAVLVDLLGATVAAIASGP